MKKIIILSLIITSLFVISCKNGSDSSSSSSSTTTTPAATPLEGIWKDNTLNQMMAFTGSNMTITQPGMPNPSDPTNPNVTMVVAGTFRLANGNLYMTPKTITVSVGTTPMTQAEQESYLSGNPMVLNTEMLCGAYAISGTTLTITDPDTSTTQTYIKQ